MVFLRPRANVELVPKFHITLHASNAALPMVTLKVLPYTNATLTFALDHLVHGGMGEGALHQEERNCQTKIIKMGPGTKTNWPTDRWLQYNFKLNLHHCTANKLQIRPLVREGAIYEKIKKTQLSLKEM
jgi:hypothetical protein